MAEPAQNRGAEQAVKPRLAALPSGVQYWEEVEYRGGQYLVGFSVDTTPVMVRCPECKRTDTPAMRLIFEVRHVVETTRPRGSTRRMLVVPDLSGIIAQARLQFLMKNPELVRCTVCMGI